MSRVIHFEIAAADPAAAVAFYEDTFGWTAEKWAGPVDYWLVETGGADEPGIDGAVMPREGPDPELEADAPVTGYLCTVEVDDVDAALERVAANGGTALSEPQAVPEVGRHAYAADPAGNRFGLMEPAEGA